jgi:plasmid stabilization system protein ParE
MTHRLRVTDGADADPDRLLGALAGRSPEAAARLAQRYYDALARLRTMPLSCGLAHEAPHFAEELRHLLFGLPGGRKYRALFVVRGDEVVVLAIRAPGEEPIGPEDLAAEG